MRRDRLEAFARAAPTHDDRVVVEATGNAAAVAEGLAPHVGRVGLDRTETKARPGAHGRRREERPS